MAIKRIVPFITTGDNHKVTFANGDRQLADWEQPYATDRLSIDLTGKPMVELNYEEWLEKVYHTMLVRQQLVNEVRSQYAAHFKRF